MRRNLSMHYFPSFAILNKLPAHIHSSTFSSSPLPLPLTSSLCEERERGRERKREAISGTKCILFPICILSVFFNSFLSHLLISEGGKPTQITLYLFHYVVGKGDRKDLIDWPLFNIFLLPSLSQSYLLPLLLPMNTVIYWSRFTTIKTVNWNHSQL